MWTIREQSVIDESKNEKNWRIVEVVGMGANKIV
jgi:hypothetical protein